VTTRASTVRRYGRSTDASVTGLRHLPHVRPWQKLSEGLSYAGFRQVVTRRFRLPDGREADFDVVANPDTVAVVALTEAGEVILVREYRPGPETLLYELPGGAVDDGETPLEAARRELAEETGYEGDLRAVAFARMKTGQLGFKGISREANLIPGVYTVPDHFTAKKFAGSWEDLLATWRREIDRLGENFASGDAKVDPKRALATCERCDLKPLCRVHERLGALAEDEEGDEFEEEE